MIGKYESRSSANTHLDVQTFYIIRKISLQYRINPLSCTVFHKQHSEYYSYIYFFHVFLTSDILVTFHITKGVQISYKEAVIYFPALSILWKKEIKKINLPLRRPQGQETSPFEFGKII